MNHLTVLLIEDDENACKAFMEYSKKLNDISIMSITDNSKTALMNIRVFLPDVVILNLELHNNESGFEVLHGLKDMNLNFYPYMLITTNNSSHITYEYARQLGIDYIMSKHQEHYSEKNVLDFLMMMKSVIQGQKGASSPVSLIAESPNHRSKRIAQRIMTELNHVGISPKAKGYQYLMDAIQIVMDKPTQKLSTIIGDKYQKTEASVERAMQNAINRAWKQTDIDELSRYYTAHIHSDKGVPTITDFIYYYAAKLNNEC